MGIGLSDSQKKGEFFRILIDGYIPRALNLNILLRRENMNEHTGARFFNLKFKFSHFDFFPNFCCCDRRRFVFSSPHLSGCVTLGDLRIGPPSQLIFIKQMPFDFMNLPPPPLPPSPTKFRRKRTETILHSLLEKLIVVSMLTLFPTWHTGLTTSCSLHLMDRTRFFLFSPHLQNNYFTIISLVIIFFQI